MSSESWTTNRTSGDEQPREEEPRGEDPWEEEPRDELPPDEEPGEEEPRDGLPPDEAPPRILPRAEHRVSRKQMSEGAVKVLYRLMKAGYKSYLCGGAVRDLMMGIEPKDFDVCTDAEPRDLRRLFRNARIIGRRFRLAHVIFHDGIVEVSTFRRAPDPQEQRDPGELLITDDNVFGNPREDAFRRDFTINALFYNVADFSVIDYVGGIEDLEMRLVRVIGDPDLRFQEDPVRMLRACEFAGRLGFTIEARTQEAIERHREELRKAAPARLNEELLGLLRSGAAGASIQWMLELGLLEVLLPEALAMVAARERGAGNMSGILPTLDAMQNAGREISDEVLLGAILLPSILLRRFEIETASRRFMAMADLRRAVQEILDGFVERFPIANYKRALVVQALEGFHRLCDTRWTQVQRRRLAAKSYFDDGLALFEILVEATGEGRQALAGWQALRRQRPRREGPRIEPRRRAPRRRGRRRR